MKEGPERDREVPVELSSERMGTELADIEISDADYRHDGRWYNHTLDRKKKL